MATPACFWKHRGLVHEKTIFSQGTSAGSLSWSPLHRANTKLRSLDGGGREDMEAGEEERRAAAFWGEVLNQSHLFWGPYSLSLSFSKGEPDTMQRGGFILGRWVGRVRDEFFPPRSLRWEQQCAAQQSLRPLTVATCIATGPRVHFTGNYLHHYSAAGASAVACTTIRKHTLAWSGNALHPFCKQRMKNDLWWDDINTRQSQYCSCWCQPHARHIQPVGLFFVLFCYIPVGGACFT